MGKNSVVGQGATFIDHATGGATTNENPIARIFDPLGIGPAGGDHSLQHDLDPFNIFSPTHSGSTLNELLAKKDAQDQAAAAKLKPPSPSDATSKSIATQVSDTQRRLFSRTLFTGGEGVLDTPTTASSTLLGA